MTASRAAGALLLAGTLLLTGCATDARGALRGAVGDLTEATNARDADRVRSAADEVLARLDDAVRANEVTTAEAARISELTRLTRDNALAAFTEADPEPAPVEEPTEEPSVAPEPEPTTEPPSPSPTPPPSPSPAPSPAPEPEEPEEPDEPAESEAPTG